MLAATNDVLDRFARLEAFAYGHVSTDSGDEAAQALLSRLTSVEARITALRTRFDAWLGTLDLDPLIAASPAAAAHAWPLRKAARRAAHQMSEPEESLAAELGITGSSAWSRLYDDVSAGVTATVEHADGRTETLPIFAVRGLATHPDAAVREAAFRAELTAWQANATPIAAALNAIKGETLALGARRGWDDPLSPVLEASAVERDGVRRHAGRGRRLAARLPPLPGRQGPPARQGPLRLLGPVRARRRRPRAVVARRHGHRRAGLRRLRRRPGRPGVAGRSASAGSTPAPGPGRSAAPSACTRATAPAASS